MSLTKINREKEAIKLSAYREIERKVFIFKILFSEKFQYCIFTLV